MNLKRIYDLVIRPWPPVNDLRELADFIDEQAAFVSQKGIYEYSRARAGHYAKVLFKEPDFIDAVDRARWHAYPLGLAMVAEIVEGILRPFAVQEPSRQLAALRELTLSVFDRYPVPKSLSSDTWNAARSDLARRLDLIGLHPPKFAKDVPEPFADPYFRLMPIHPKLKSNDAPAIKSYLRVTMCNVHDECSQRVDRERLCALLRLGAH